MVGQQVIQRRLRQHFVMLVVGVQRHQADGHAGDVMLLHSHPAAATFNL
jgi:hypothetical protein